MATQASPRGVLGAFETQACRQAVAPVAGLADHMDRAIVSMLSRRCLPDMARQKISTPDQGSQFASCDFTGPLLGTGIKIRRQSRRRRDQGTNPVNDTLPAVPTSRASAIVGWQWCVGQNDLSPEGVARRGE
jgi:hypothetical protein